MSGLLTTADVDRAVPAPVQIEAVRENRIRIAIGRDQIPGTIRAVQEKLACDHLIAISCMDNGRTFGLIYHLTGPHRTVISVAAEIPREDPGVATVSDLLPPAGIYERQIHDLFGIVFNGHPGLKRLMLNEDWPEGEYPLRKDWSPKKGVSYGGPGKEGG